MYKMDRNAACWCGSGKKYKTCHEEFDEKYEALREKGFEMPERKLIKNEAQIEAIRESAKINVAVLDYVAEHIHAGITTEEIDHWVYEETTRRGGIPAPLNYEGFPASICTSVNDRIVHGAIRASNVLVASDGTVRLINYESMRIPPSGSMHGSVIDNDNIVVANLALALRVLRDDPSLFYTLRGNSMFRLPILRSSLLPMFAHAVQKSGCVPMQALVEMLSTCNHTLHSRRELSEVLEALTADRTPVTVDLSKIAIDSEEETYMHEMACENERKLRDNSFKAQYSWVGGMSEALISAEQNGKWGYIDGEGRVVLPFQYKWASDFAEGRAVVVAPSGTYALIDKTGREILPAMYELMEWDAVHGVVKVSYEGVFGLADRNGTEIVPLQYDWMGDTDNSLILVRDEAGRCGYIRHDGKQAIALQYDDAYDFDEQNKALVVLGDRSFYIDLEGNELFEADEMKVAR